MIAAETDDGREVVQPEIGAQIVLAADVLSAIASAQVLRDVVTVNFNVVRELTVADLDDIDENTRIDAVKLLARR